MNEEMRLVRLTEDYVFKSFDCGEKDLNEFLLFDSKDYLKRLSLLHISLRQMKELWPSFLFQMTAYLLQTQTRLHGAKLRNYFRIQNIVVITPL